MRHRLSGKTTWANKSAKDLKSTCLVEGPLQIFYRGIMQRPQLFLILISLAMLVPFLSKPFNIDDPMFIWLGKQIQAHPANPFGFDVNWYARSMPFWQVNQNPPLAGYCIALVAAILGWSEVALHAAFTLAAVLVIFGIYRLADHFCERPLVAALTTLFTPVFLVSSTTIMADVPMLLFWVWAVVFWVEGCEKNKSAFFGVSGLFMTLALLTLYFAISLVPLLLAYSLFRWRRWDWRLLWLFMPLLALLGFEVWTHALYGRGLFSQAMNYAGAEKLKLGESKTDSVFIGLSFIGGGVGLAVFLTARFWTWRKYLAVGLAGTLLALIPLVTGMLVKKYAAPVADARLALNFQFVFWVMVGLAVLILTLEDFLCHRNPASVLLGLWVIGTFVFASCINWDINGRSLLPVTPAVGILLARRLTNPSPRHFQVEALILSLAAGLALWVAWSDFRLAVAVRQSAQVAVAKLNHPKGTVWFQGHWGFQYYMEQSGLPAMEEASNLTAGDEVIVPLNNACLIDLDPSAIELMEAISITGPRFLATTSLSAGAGFYASTYGPLLFAFGSIEPEKVLIVRLKP
jgi:4-amino-4-deoxy-L-arabinose transferase-like glycosyltransferase